MSSDASSDSASETIRELQVVAGALSSGVAGALARPLRELREHLAIMVETLDRHVTESKGPTPYPWKSLQLMRQELADTYLLSRQAARLAGDLADAVGRIGTRVEAVDVNRLVESALNLARHRIRSHTEVFIDLGSVPMVRATAGELVLAFADVMLCCADSAATREGSAISIKTRHDGDTDEVVVYIADNGGGQPERAREIERMLARMAEQLGGTFEGTSEEGAGSVFEWRVPARKV